MLFVRPFAAQDWPAMREIYAQGIATGMATFETRVPATEELDRKFIAEPRIAAVAGTGLVGWAMLQRISARECYRGVAELSVYVAESVRGLGVGKLLLRALIEASEAEGFWTLQATILQRNLASIALHESVGFRQVGYREAVACLHDRWENSVLMERRSPNVGIQTGMALAYPLEVVAPPALEEALQRAG